MDDLTPMDNQIVWIVVRGTLTERGAFGADLAEFTSIAPGPVDVPSLMAERDLVTPFPAGWWLVVKGESEITVHLMAPGDVAERANAAAQALATEMSFAPDFAVRFAPPFTPETEIDGQVATLRWALAPM